MEIDKLVFLDSFNVLSSTGCSRMLRKFRGTFMYLFVRYNRQLMIAHIFCQRRSRWRHHDTLDKRNCCLVDERMTSPLFGSSSKQESMPWVFLTAFWTESKQHRKKMWRRLTNVAIERRKKQIEPNYSTWCGASWFSALTRQASTPSEGTSRTGLQSGQLWWSSTNKLNGLVLSHWRHSSQGLKMTSGEKVTDYLTKAEGLKLDLAEIRGKWSQMLSSKRWFSRVFQDTATVLWQSSISAQQRGSTRWSRTWSTTQPPGVSVFLAKHQWQPFTQTGVSL